MLIDAGCVVINYVEPFDRFIEPEHESDCNELLHLMRERNIITNIVEINGFWKRFSGDCWIPFSKVTDSVMDIFIEMLRARAMQVFDSMLRTGESRVSA